MAREVEVAQEAGHLREAAVVAAVASAVGWPEEAGAERVVRGDVFFVQWVALAPIEEAGRGPAREGVKRRRLRLRPRRDLLDLGSDARFPTPPIPRCKEGKHSKGGSPSVPWPIRDAIRRRPTSGRGILAAIPASQAYTSPHARPTRPTSAGYEGKTRGIRPPTRLPHPQRLRAHGKVAVVSTRPRTMTAPSLALRMCACRVLPYVRVQKRKVQRLPHPHPADSQLGGMGGSC